MSELAEIISEILGGIEIELGKSEDKEYLTDNPQRRYPDLTRAKTELDYIPNILPEVGLERVIEWYKQTYF